MILKCPAKINLFLNITNRRNDNYHDIKTIIQTINLFDYITIDKRKDNDIVIKSNDKNVPCDNTNSVYKAIIEFYRYVDKDIKGYDIYIEKNIPIQSGLGGESSDAASIIKYLNIEFKLKKECLIEIANKVGNDCKFFIIGGCLNENLEKVNNKFRYYYLLNNKNDKCSTREMFYKYDLLNNFEDLEEKINMHNDFEKIYNIENTKINLRKLGSVMEGLTGSGSYVVGVFNKKIDNCYENYNEGEIL